MSQPEQSDTMSQLKRALGAIKELRGRLDASERARSEPIAIIGMGCRVPGGANPQAFWELLHNGVDAISEVPSDRWDAAALYDADPEANGKIATRWGGFLPAIDQFDPAFFGISPREAAAMDPQQRLLLEVAYETFENAGQTTESLAGSKTGVFVGVHSHSNDYYLLQAADPASLDTYSGTGTSHSVVAGRLSYIFDLHGPSVALDTACSSSLVAIHLAVQSLRGRECRMALAGGVNVMLEPTFSITASRMRMMAADGRCKTFDAAADGFVRGEGCGLVMLKRLSDARADGDRILAVVAGTALNQDGHTNGLTAPNGLSQQAVIRAALANAGIDPQQIGYVEAHGTGTPLGDPIEVEALTAVYDRPRSPENPVLLGSAKTNIGHLEGAAGVIGLIKTVLSLRNEQIPPLVHFRTLNPLITLTDTALVIPTEPHAWPRGATPRYAAVSSFGWSGTNAHLIVGEAPQPVEAADTPLPETQPLLLTLSARSTAALRAQAQNIADLLRQKDAPAAYDLCHHAAMRHSHHDQRLAVVGRSVAELADRLGALARSEPEPGVLGGIVFVFPGQGSQWPGMARQLLADEPVFRAELERCDQAIRAEAGWSPIAQLTATENDQLDQIDRIQPTLFAIQVSLAALWRAYGILPEAVVGHSMGEVAAAYVAGALSLEDAVRVICRRSRLLRRISGQGAMAVVGLSLDEAATEIASYSDRLAVAVNNSPRSTVLSGDPAALAAVLAQLQARNIFCRPVNVDVASHSPQVDSLRQDLLTALQGISPQTPTTPFYSTVTGAAPASFDPSYWVQNLRQPVLFAGAIDRLLSDGRTTFIELSPHPVLLTAIEESIRAAGAGGQTLPSMLRNQGDRTAMLESLAKLYTHGASPNWRGLYPRPGQFVDLPSYPWQHRRYWITASPTRSTPMNQTDTHGALGQRLPDLAHMAGAAFWERTISAEQVLLLPTTRIAGAELIAGALYTHMALLAAVQVAGPQASITEIQIAPPLARPATLRLQTIVTSAADTSTRVQIFSYDQATSSWDLRAEAHFLAEVIESLPAPLDLTGLRARCVAQPAPISETIVEYWQGAHEVLGRLAPSDAQPLPDDPHPARYLEAGLQALRHLAMAPELLLSQIETLQAHGSLLNAVWAYARLNTGGDDAINGDLLLLDAEGQILLEARGIQMSAPTQALLEQLALQRTDEWLYQVAWRAQPLAASAATHATGSWLIFDAEGLGEQLALHMATMGQQAILVTPGSSYMRQDATHFQIDPTQPADMQRLLGEAGTITPPLRGALYLWALRATNSLDIPPQTAQTLVYAGALHLAQALASAEQAGTPPIWFVTRGAQYVITGDDTIAAQAPLWGLGRVLNTEHPDLWGGLIDLDPARPADELFALLAEIQAPAANEQIAIRGADRYVARLTQSILPTGQPFVLRPDASYLITGGMGGLGLELARWLVGCGARHLALMGRSAPTAAAQAAIADLEAAGAQVRIVRGDIGKHAAAAAALAEIAETMPPLCGLIHAAGVLDDAMLRKQQYGSFERVMTPKIAGAWNLHTLTANAKLDFFVLFSSATALLGTPSQANYAAANAYLDALAHARRAHGLPALSINWGMWGEVGLAMNAGRSEQLTRRGLITMPVQAGLALLERLITCSPAQVAALAIDWPTYGSQLPLGQVPALFDQLISAPPQADSQPHAGPDLRQQIEAQPPAARHEALKRITREQVAAVMGFASADDVAPQQGFFQMGMDSLTAIELKNRLQAALSLSLPSTLAFDYPTADSLALYLRDRIFIPVVAEPSIPTSETESDLQALGQLSRADLKALIDDELESIDF